MKTHLLVSLSWFQHHEGVGKPVTVWEFCDVGFHAFIPAQFIIQKTISLVDKLYDLNGKVLFVSPYV